jgi:hypothetical protein
MSENEQQDKDQGLVESQGVNAGLPVDKEIPTRRGHDAAASSPSPPDGLGLQAAEPDERVGVPEQRSGYPGQQKSVDTS